MAVVDQFVDFLKDLVRSREILFTMTRRDFSDRYLGSYLGLLWAFIHPLASILVLWLVFQMGFKCKPVGGCPFVLWLASGMIPWLFFSEAMSRAGFIDIGSGVSRQKGLLPHEYAADHFDRLGDAGPLVLLAGVAGDVWDIQPFP